MEPQRPSPSLPTNTVVASHTQRRVLLVDFTWTRDKDPRIPLGHASLLAALQTEATLDVRSLVVAVNTSRCHPEAVVSRILMETSDCGPSAVDVAFGAYVWGEDTLTAVLRGLRVRGFRGRIIVGGPQVSYAGAGIEGLYPEADVFIRGYGERALCLLTRTHEPQAIAGVHFRGETDRVEQALVDLEALPSPWLGGLKPVAKGSFVRWETQRGCPFRCGFCQHREAGARLLRRSLGLPRIEAEIDLFCRAGVGEIAVLDPIFNAGPHAVGVLQRFVDHRFAGHLTLQCRAETVTTEFLEVAAQLEPIGNMNTFRLLYGKFT